MMKIDVFRPYRKWEATLDRLVSDEVHRAVDSMTETHNANAYGYDRWGVSPAAAKRALAFVKLLYERYFRVRTHGLAKIPDGRALIVGNHSGQLAYDGMLIAAAFALERSPPRMLRAMIERFFANPPFR